MSTLRHWLHTLRGRLAALLVDEILIRECDYWTEIELNGVAVNAELKRETR